jgi:hypothetical protein
MLIQMWYNFNMYKNTNTHKFCPKCEQMLLREEFYKDAARKDGITAYCKLCKNTINKNWQDNNIGNYRKSQLRQRRKREYGVSDQDVADMLEKQSNSCAICRTEIDWNCHVDHCHKTGVVRGLLCASCNKGLGLFGDDTVRLNNAIKYLESQ